MGTVVKIKEISCIKGDGYYETTDTRYRSKKSLKRIVKYCIKNGFSFKVGFNNNKLISNKNYIEITDDWFSHFGNDRDSYYDKGEKLKEWIANGSKY